MIVDWLLTIGASVGGFVGGLFPRLTIPSGLANLDDSINGLFSLGTGLAPWIDLGYVAALAGILGVVWVSGLSTKAFRAIASHLPFVGGRG